MQVHHNFVFSYFQKTVLKTILLSIKSTIIIALLSLSSAHAFYIGSVEIKVVDASQAQLPSYHHRGQHYIMGRYNQRYMLKVINHSSERFELVMTVDGRDVINGSAGHYGNRGYVINPHSQFNIEGFRRSDSEVAAFRFTTPGDSYAGRLGKGSNIGVIGVALFSEQASRIQVPTYQKRSNYLDDHSHTLDQGESLNAQTDSLIDHNPPQHQRARLGSLNSAKKSRHSRRRRPQNNRSEIGTRYGENRHSQVENTQFVRLSKQPDQVLVINYDSEQGLRRRGVIAIKQSHPTPFPNENSYAPPPPAYR